MCGYDFTKRCIVQGEQKVYWALKNTSACMEQIPIMSFDMTGHINKKQAIAMAKRVIEVKKNKNKLQCGDLATGSYSVTAQN